MCKRDAEGRVVTTYSGIVLARSHSKVALLATYTGDTRTVGQAVLEPGDQFVEHHYADRWYNVFKVYRPDPIQLTGWYCNITRPAAIHDALVTADDLALDLWAEPGCPPCVLDWDQFQALDLSTAEHKAALNALDQLQNLAKAGKLPRTLWSEGRSRTRIPSMEDLC